MFFYFLVDGQESFVDGSRMAQTQLTIYQQIHHISLSYITARCLPPIKHRRLLVFEMKSSDENENKLSLCRTVTG